ncbi:hypothetical protein F4777DRAFT_132249 [Nemania sp. FL0916]|nr:hypothetical protein F4777DRAFT_132249 [Nemania sp. FL0916]
MRFPIELPFHKGIYRRLRLSEEEKPLGGGEEYAEEPAQCRSRRWHIVTTLAIIALAVALATVSTLYIQLLHEKAPKPLLTCGKTVDEARQAGCSFDVLTKTWLSPKCPRSYEQDFLDLPATLNMNITKWPYWFDKTLKEMSDEDMALRATTRATTESLWIGSQRMHIAHCAFIIKRRSDAIENGDRVDRAIEPLGHMHHCVDQLLEAAMRADGIDGPSVQGHAIFGAC